ncbi:MAG: prolipoprotein diacylglyceryl transferase [Candidatus Melainabacteria bacterium]|nr:prolipoprotein diacylglyceryl transferase [Candidatus Melainabacteria bacterium]
MLNNLPVITLSSPGPIAFQFFNLSIRWYGIFIALGFLIGYFIAETLAKKNNLNLNSFSNLIFFILIFSIIFARLYFVFLSWDYFKSHINEIPKIWLGGQSIHGGILGAVIGALIYSKISKISFYKYIDIIAVAAPLGQAIGRWGNFFNNEAFGKPAYDWIIRLYIPFEFRPEQFLNVEYFHPAFLYESFFDLLIFIFLYNKYFTWKEKPGKIFWTYLLCYSVIRFFLEFLRVDSLYIFGNIPVAQVVSVLVLVLALVFLLRSK